MFGQPQTGFASAAAAQAAFTERRGWVHHGVKTLQDLDEATSYALNGDYSGIAEHLRAEGEFTRLAATFPYRFDPRITPEKWLATKIDRIVDEVFEGRYKAEGKLSRNELLAFDQQIAQAFD